MHIIEYLVLKQALVKFYIQLELASPASGGQLVPGSAFMHQVGCIQQGTPHLIILCLLGSVLSFDMCNGYIISYNNKLPSSATIISSRTSLEDPFSKPSVTICQDCMCQLAATITCWSCGFFQ